jgi:DNA replicative helicase MCM subunit Mcm2 (Cdc46/Mcm family)
MFDFRNSIFSATFKGNTLGPFVSKKDGTISLDAGILLSGNGGVTHIPELTAIRKKELNFLEHAMEKPDVGTLSG